MFRLLILADDLSGAADCGVACAISDLDTVVTLGDVQDDIRSDVLSFDADTRGMAPKSAADEVDRIVRKYSHDGGVLLFKKIDSTLRGNIGIELAAALNAHRDLNAGKRPTVAVMAPAFPSIGRTTVNGFQMLHGQPLHKMEIWRLHDMLGSSYIPDMLQNAGLKSGVVQLDVIRSTTQALEEAMRLSANEVDVLVCDAETDADLHAIIRASMKIERKTVWVGSAGLAYHLHHAIGLGGTTAVAKRVLPPISGPLLFVMGSLSRNTSEQVHILASSSETLRLLVPPAVLLEGTNSASWHDYQRELEQAIGMNQDVVLGIGSELQVEILMRHLLSASLARLTSSVSDKVGAVIASGGETARMVLQNWGVTSLRLIGELEKGIPISITEAWSRPLPVITKAGDFGYPEILLRCGQFLHNPDRGVN